jgi:predicted permease
MIDDARFALRQLRKNPGFAVAAVITLALGIGAAAAMFGLVQNVLLSPPPYADPQRLVLVSPARLDGRPYTSGNTIGQWTAWRSEARTIEPPAMYRWTFNFLVLPDGSESLAGMVVTTNFFKVAGLTPVLGRELTDAEAGRPKVPPTGIILGYELWQRKYNGDPDIIGRAVSISRQPAPLPIVGVMPPGVRFLPDPGNASEPNYDVDARVDFWVAVALDETQPRARGWNTIARLRDGSTPEQARRELATLTARLVPSDPNLDGITSTVRPLLETLNDEARGLLMPLLGAVGLVFFVACVNVAGLYVARGLQRHREYAMRAALGASRARLFRQVLTESLVISIASAVVGAAVAAGTINIFRSIGGHAIPRADAVTVGWPLFAFGFVAALVSALVAGLLPAGRASRPRYAEALQGIRTTAGRSERRLLAVIATVQIVFTVALLAGAALLTRTAGNLARVRPGYEIENILAVTVTTVTPNTFRQFHTGVLDRVAALPGVTHAAFAWGLPLTGNKWSGSVELIGRSDGGKPLDQSSFPLRSVTPDYFDLMGMRIVEGRGFRPSDNADSPRVAVINQVLARRYFPDASPVGKQMRFPGDPKRPIEIVGVIADTRTEALSEQTESEVYLPFWQSGAFSKHLVLRASSDPRALADLVRREVRAVDPTAAVERFTTMAQIRRDSLAARTFAMRLLIGFSLLATALALVGIYGVLSLSVGVRVKEIAVRKAVGAQGRDILRLILGEGSKLIAVGTVLGAMVATSVGRVLESQLFEVRAFDPLSFGGAALLFGIVALGACLLPAVRAARTDLLGALHQE